VAGYRTVGTQAVEHHTVLATGRRTVPATVADRTVPATGRRTHRAMGPTIHIQRTTARRLTIPPTGTHQKSRHRRI
jgi:hypothetical protein